MVADTDPTPGGARTAPSVVVLQAGIHVVGAVHVGCYPVRKARRHRAQVLPCGALVPTDREAGVRPAHDVVRVGRIDPVRVLVDGLVPEAKPFVDLHERPAAVERLRRAHIRHVEHVGVGGIDAQLAEVHRASVTIADERPAAPLVLRPVNAGAGAAQRRWFQRVGARGRRGKSAVWSGIVAPVVATTPATATAQDHRGRIASVGLDLGVHDARIRPRDLDRNAAIGPGRQPRTGQFRPGAARILALPQRASRTTAIEAASRAPALVAGCEEHAGVGWIHHEVGEARVLVDVLDLRPGAPAIGRLVDAAIGTGAEQRTVRRDVNDVRVLRMEDDARDGLRLAQPDVRECPAAVGGLVYPVTE